MVINELGTLKQDEKSIDAATGSMNLPCMEPYINLFKKHIRNCVVKQDKLNMKNDDNNAMDF